jgi:hypothetical protein
LKGGSDVEENEEIGDENDQNTPLKAAPDNNDSQV